MMFKNQIVSGRSPVAFVDTGRRPAPEDTGVPSEFRRQKEVSSEYQRQKEISNAYQNKIF